MARISSAGNWSKIKGLTNAMDVEGYEEIPKTKAKNPHKISYKQNSRRWTYKQKPFRKIKEKIQAKLLFEPTRKTQSQCKITMAHLERNQRKNSGEKSVSTNNAWNGKQNYIW